MRKRDLPGKIVSSALAGALILGVLTVAGLSGSPPGIPPPPRSRDFGASNLERVREFLSTTSGPASNLDDYDFAVIGDVQNSVRNLNHDVFEAIAGDMYQARDAQTGEALFDKIRFVVLLGDIAYEGPVAAQWEALRRAFAGEAPDGRSYPNLARLAAAKPFFPVLGNHELLSFRPRLQTRYMDLFDSAKGVRNFKSFFDWDGLIADPRILYPVPADLPADFFGRLGALLPEAADRLVLNRSYVRKRDGRYHLKLYESPSLDAAAFSKAKESLAAELAPIFRKAGYGTLPVLNSDNMICYAFEAGGVVYVFLDSMARGWHYPAFRKLKESLHPASADVHRLNLFSRSPFNGQADFFEAVARYARDRGLALVPMMHHSVFNDSRDIYSTGVEYNVWLALGLPQAAGEAGDPTIFDEIVFSDAPATFGACVHAYEHFSLVAKSPGRDEHVLQCYVTGGGGGPLRGDFSLARNELVASLYNQKLAREPGPPAGRSVEIRDDEPRVGFHYLIVHVRQGKLVGVSPRFLEKTERFTAQPGPRLSLEASFSSRPSSLGATVTFCPGEWIVQGFRGYLAFASWTPSVSVGVLSYNTWRVGSEARATAASVDVSPLAFKLHLPGTRNLTLRLPGIRYWGGGDGRNRFFLTLGVEAPLIYDIFGRMQNFNVGVTALVPIHRGDGTDPGFGTRTTLALSAGFRFRL